MAVLLRIGLVLFTMALAIAIPPRLASASQGELGADKLLQLIAEHQWVALAAIAIGGLVRLAKSEKIYELVPIPPKARPWLALGLGAVSGILEMIVAGTPWQSALVRGLMSAALAAMGHDALIEGLRGGKEIGAK